VSDSGTTLTLDEVKITAPAPVVQPVQAPFAIRKINLIFQLGTGNFGAGTGQQITYQNLRAHVQIEQVVSPQTTGVCIIHAFGMSLQHMNQLSVAGLLFDGRQNYVTVEAGDDTVGMTTIFKGVFIEAYPDINQPEAPFYVFAQPAVIPQLKMVAPSTYNASGTLVATILQDICTKAGMTLQNNGVTATLSSSYFPGTAWQQIKAVIKAANCFAFFDGKTNTLIVWPKTGAQPSGSAVVVSKDTGMQGYPKFEKAQVIVAVLFNPMFNLNPAATIQIESQITAANGKFTLNRVSHDLFSQMPKGPWETVLQGSPTNTASGA
jgi:hypothetical protein